MDGAITKKNPTPKIIFFLWLLLTLGRGVRRKKQPWSCLFSALCMTSWGMGWAVDRVQRMVVAMATPPHPSPGRNPTFGRPILNQKPWLKHSCGWGFMKITPSVWIHPRLTEEFILFSSRATYRLSLFCPPGYLQKYLEDFRSPLKFPYRGPIGLKWDYEFEACWEEGNSFGPLEKPSLNRRKKKRGESDCKPANTQKLYKITHLNAVKTHITNREQNPQELEDPGCTWSKFTINFQGTTQVTALGL